MYLNIGKTAVIPEETVIGIFDLDTTTQSFLTREFLAAASQSTSRTLSKRMNQMEEERRTKWRKSMN